MSNPVLNEARWDVAANAFGSDRAMTVNGAVTKTGILVVLMLAAGTGMWFKFYNHGSIDEAGAMPYCAVGGLAGFAVAMITRFFPTIAAYTAPIYALCQGLFLGALTMVVNKRFPGVPLEAACLTTATLLGMLFLYQAHIIRATPLFVRGVYVAMVGLIVGSLALWGLGFLGIGGGVVSALYGSSAIGIAFSVFCVGLAAANLVINFAIIENGARQRAPRGMEWYAAFGLMVTLVWLYIEIVNLLMKTQRRN